MSQILINKTTYSFKSWEELRDKALELRDKGYTAIAFYLFGKEAILFINSLPNNIFDKKNTKRFIEMVCVKSHF